MLLFFRPGMYIMQTAKEHVRHVLDKLPDNASYDEIMYEIQFLRGIEEGLADLDAGRSISHEDVMARARQWLE